MTIKKTVHTWIIIGCTLLQHSWLTAQPFNFTVYREADGLPSGYIQKAFEDSRGYLWLCTFGGLSRFDGRNFKNYDIKDGLPDNFCDDICEDATGNLWIATRQGLCYFDGQNFTRFSPPDTTRTSYFGNCSIDKHNQLNCVLNRQNAVIINGKLQYIQLIKNISGLPVNNYVAATLSNGTKILNTDRGIYSIPNGTQARLIFPYDNFVTYLYVEPSEKDAFYFFNEKGVYHWQSGRLTSLSTIDFSNQITTALFVDNKKRVWVTVENKGVWIIDGGKTTFIDKSELPGYLVPSFYQDKRGVMWICTFRGLVKLTDKFVTHYTRANGLGNDDIRFSHIAGDGDICMQTNLIKNGIPCPLPGNLSILLQYNRFGNYIRDLQADNTNGWWVLSFGGNIYHWQNGTLENYSPQVDSATTLNSLYDAKNGMLWFGKNSTIHIIKDGKPFKTITTLADGTLLNRIVSFNQDYFGNVWVSERKRLLLYTHNGLIDFTPNLQLRQKVFAGIACSNAGGVWIKTLGLGAFHFVLVNGKWVKDKTINTDNGLPNNYVHDIEIDSKQNIWIATLNGLYRFSENKHNPNTYNIRIFTKADGIDVPNWNLAFLEKDNLNNIWLGVGNGIFKINTTAIIESAVPPAVLIDRVAILNYSDNTISSADGFKAISNNTSFSYNQSDIAFYFNGINLNNNFIRYTYLLEGIDKNWLTDKKNNEAVYYNLSPGTYTFMLKAVNDAGLESSAATYRFEIMPPFWQRIWFRLLVTLLAIASIYWFIRRRDAQKEKEGAVALQMSNLKLTALQSQMNPHFIFNSLNSIQNYILQQKPIDAARYLSKFSKLMRRILDQSFTNLIPLNDIVETLKMYMELEAFRFSNEFSWEVKVTDAESISDVKLPPLLLQPYVENAIIHGLMPKQGEKKLLIHLYRQNGELHCVIDDNGIGRGNKLAATDGHISHGQKLTVDMLATMKQLLHTEAKITIADKKDDQDNAAGTRVDLVIPLKF